jgi:hypothetical protein
MFAGMELPRHQGTLFAGGLLIGLVVGAGVLLGVREHIVADKPGPEKQAVAAAPAETKAAHCAFAPVLTAAPKGDGLFALPNDARDATAEDAQAYVAVGRDAASQGRPRDAEVAFITSCRMAGPNDTVELADAKYQLASHYASVAANDNAARGEALVRARALMSESVTLYGTRLGLDDGKTRQAAAGLAGLERNATAAAHLPLDAPLQVPRELLAERAQYESIAAATPGADTGPSASAGTTASAGAGSRSAAPARSEANAAPAPGTTTAMGGPPARRKEPAKAPVADAAPPAEERAEAARPLYVPPALPTPSDDGGTGTTP